MRRAKALPPLSEKAFMSQVVQLARLLGYKVYHTFDSRRSAAGFPDLVIAGRGRVIFAELKSEKGRESPAQAEWLDVLTAAGVTVCLWRPADFPAIERLLRGE